MRVLAVGNYSNQALCNDTCAGCCKIGKMKRNSGVEPMMQLFSRNNKY